MTSLIGPKEVILVTSRANIEVFGKKVVKNDVETVFWHMPISVNDMIYSISIPKPKNINKLINTSRLFCVNFLPYSMEKVVHRCNLLHGEHIDKFEELNLEKHDAVHMECPVISSSSGWIECQVIETKEFSDYVLYIAKIINSKIVSNRNRLYHVVHDRYITLDNNHL